MNCKAGILIFISIFISSVLFAQTLTNDTAIVKNDSAIKVVEPNQKKDSIVKPRHDGRIATRRSLIIPGWGQAYNREYWKIPIVYGVLAIPTSTFIYNNNWYKITKNAYNLLYAYTYGSNGNAPTLQDTLNLQNISTKQNLRAGVISGYIDLATLQSARNAYRKDRDYSIFWFIIVWGINVADATVFGHLKDFDVSDNLSIHVQPTFNPSTNSPGMSLVFNIKTPRHNIKTLSW